MVYQISIGSKRKRMKKHAFYRSDSALSCLEGFYTSDLNFISKAPKILPILWESELTYG